MATATKRMITYVLDELWTMLPERNEAIAESFREVNIIAGLADDPFRVSEVCTGSELAIDIRSSSRAIPGPERPDLPRRLLPSITRSLVVVRLVPGTVTAATWLAVPPRHCYQRLQRELIPLVKGPPLGAKDGPA